MRLAPTSRMALAGRGAAAPVAVAFAVGGARFAATLGRIALHLSFVGRLLSAVATLVILILVGVVIGPVVVAGWRPYVVYTASMAPAIPVGAIVLVQPIPVEKLAPGDVITFARPQDPGLPVTHRIVKTALDLDKGAWQIVTKGDANVERDVWSVTSDQVVGRVAYSVPLAGYLLVWMAAPIGKQVLLTFIGLTVLAKLATRRVHAARSDPRG